MWKRGFLTFAFCTNRNVNIEICSKGWWEIEMKPVCALINLLLNLVWLDINFLGKNYCKYLLHLVFCLFVSGVSNLLLFIFHCMGSVLWHSNPKYFEHDVWKSRLRNKKIFEHENRVDVHEGWKYVKAEEGTLQSLDWMAFYHMKSRMKLYLPCSLLSFPFYVWGSFLLNRKASRVFSAGATFMFHFWYNIIIRINPQVIPISWQIKSRG